MGFSGSLQKMTIIAYSNVNFTDEVGRMSVFLNPTTYAHNFKICYNNRQAQGSNGGSPEFNRVPSETLKFELVFDGTGVVAGPLPGVPTTASDGVKDQVDEFKNLVFAYDGNIHSPKYL